MEHPIGNLMDTTMNKIKEMIDVNTIVGEPITSPDGTLIIPVSKVSYGFASGGSDLPTKKENKDCFGGGSGAGVTIQPVAFLTVYKGDVKLIPVDKFEGTPDRLVGMIPEVIDKVKEIFKKDDKKKSSKADDDFSEITMDDTNL
ncbi:GerW family sporulation protein [Ruminococcus sp.]|uniref:GerW family sporulation protein n=1 Tax=Ruminococcus sp. TaxID=41978 RepID=UPI0025CE01F6|nr:GerW family sporulation protein [Ruminococcus sp.]MCI6616758.1 GerW family sporulation protein [Ruminococcus sp.]